MFVGSWEANVVTQTRTCPRTEKKGPKLSNRVDPNTCKTWGAVLVRTLQSTVWRVKIYTTVNRESKSPAVAQPTRLGGS